MPTSTTIDQGDYIQTLTGEPAWDNPTVWQTSSIAWKAGTVGANVADLQSKAQNAIDANSTFLAIASPTNAQAVAQIQRLTRENTAIIRLLLGLLDSTAGT
jgi:hypothetical protein